MAFTTSKVFAAMLLDALGNTAAYDLDGDTFKAALYGDGATPDNTVSAANTVYNVDQWVTANEKSNGGWAAGGIALTTPTWTRSTNVNTFDAVDTANGSAATLAAVTGVLVYDTTVASKGICFNYLGGSNSVTAGTLTVVWNASGIFTLTAT